MQVRKRTTSRSLYGTLPLSNHLAPRLPMRAVADDLRHTLTLVLPHLQALDADTRTHRPAPDRWTKQEILGHLIDSAANNHQKFVRMIAQQHLDFPGYAQNHWVTAQRWNTADWPAMLALWAAYNRHLADLIEHAAPEALAHTITIDGAGPFRLDFVMTDYVEHLKHHLKQLLPDLPLDSSFENVYDA
ncbi:MAG: hypothetical protein RhofKO_23020 [Rhodothermales bacterium]